MLRAQPRCLPFGSRFSLPGSRADPDLASGTAGMQSVLLLTRPDDPRPSSVLHQLRTFILKLLSIPLFQMQHYADLNNAVDQLAVREREFPGVAVAHPVILRHVRGRKVRNFPGFFLPQVDRLGLAKPSLVHSRRSNNAPPPKPFEDPVRPSRR